MNEKIITLKHFKSLADYFKRKINGKANADHTHTASEIGALTNIKIGTVITGAAGSSASAETVTDGTITTLNLTIPKGDTEAVSAGVLVPETSESLIFPENVDRIVNKNYLKNWYFKNPENTSGTTKWDDDGKAWMSIIDEWFANTDAYVQSCEAFLYVATKNTSSSKAGVTGRVCQYIDLAPLLGKTVTFSCLEDMQRGTGDNTFYCRIKLYTDQGFNISKYYTQVSYNFPATSGWQVASLTVKFADEIDETEYNNNFTENRQLRVVFEFYQNNVSASYSGVTGYLEACKAEISDSQTLAYQDENGEWVVNLVSTEGENRNLNDFIGFNGEIRTYKLIEKNSSPFLNAPEGLTNTNGILTVTNYSGENADDPELKCKQSFDSFTDGRTFTRFFSPENGWSAWTA